MRTTTIAALATILVGAAACSTARPIGGDDDPGADATPADAASDSELAAPDAAVPPDAPPAAAPAVIVMIGDGMGMAQLDAASLFRHGALGQLAIDALPHRGEARTGGPSGITDSAAAATVIATGAYTLNGRVGIDRDGQAVETILERAAARGWATGVVTTTSLPHATPAGFTAHVGSRHDLAAIAHQQATATRPDVMLGGGAPYYAAYVADLAAAGYAVVGTGAELAAAAADATRVFGAFAPDHLTYARERAPNSPEPTLTEMALAAAAVLDRDPDGFFLMIEGGRIDHASHANDLANTIGETLAFDDAVAAVVAWARARGNTTVIVTADHECGGLEIVTPGGIGQLSTVAWRWGQHTNARVIAAGDGPGAEVLAGAVVDHRWVYAIARARVDGAPLDEPAREPVPDGELGELRHRAALQTAATGFGAGYNQLDALWLDATASGLHLGVEGVFEWDANAVALWIDVDPGAGTGVASPRGALSDASGAADRVIAASNLTAPAVAGWGADLVVVALGGADPQLGELRGDGGLRGLRAPYGAPGDLGWLPAAINFGAVRTRGGPLAPPAGQGMEVFVPWTVLYPAGRPPGARVAVAAVLVNDDGGYTSNQALPGFAPGTANPGRVETPIPGVVLYEVDADGDGVIDGDAPPVVLP